MTSESTLDNLSLNYSVMKKANSSIDVRNDKVNSADFSLNYSFSFDKENYWMPRNSGISILVSHYMKPRSTILQKNFLHL